MSKRKVFMVVCLLSGFLLLVVGAQAQPPANLLRNPSFEGVPVTWENAGEVKIALEWEPFHWDGLTGYPAIHDGNLGSVPTARPEFRPATLDIDPVRVYDGQQSQLWFSFYRNHYAGVQQRNIPVQAGEVYTVSVWAQAWSSASDDPRKSENEIYLTIGIDPRGDCSRYAKDTIFNNWVYIGSTFKNVESQPVRMIGNLACVSILSSTKYSAKHNDMYVDKAIMVLVPGGTGPVPTCPTPQPTSVPCPVCPTPTPGPSGDCLTKGEFDTGVAYMLRQVEALLARLTLVLQ
jgi:hypothetical protein